MKTLTITIERKPITVNFDGKSIEVDELGIRLPFGRKPADIKEIAAYGDYTVYVSETREMTAEEFDGFAMNLLKSRDWLKDQNGYLEGEVSRRMQENELIKDISLNALAALAEKRDNETGNHEE